MNGAEDMTETLSYFVANLQRDFSHYCDEELKALGLTRGLLFFILYIGRHPDCSPKELTGALRMDAGHANRALAKLEEGGFLLQAANPKDRRAHTLRLTEQGEGAFRVSHELFSRWDDAVLSDLSGGERETLLGLLRKIHGERRTEHV